MNNFPSFGIGILGATGYSGRELLRLVAAHPRLRLVFATSESDAGSSLDGLLPGGTGELVRAEDAPLGSCDAVVSCLPSGESLAWARRAHDAGARVVDLSDALRVPRDDCKASGGWARQAVYGLPELHRERIRTAELVANPGCYPTAALLAVAPLLRRGLVAGPLIVDAASGVTGAGRTARRELLFSEVAEDFRAYATGNGHRHLAELRDQTERLGNGVTPEIVFTPHLLPVRRGILETIHVQLTEPLADPLALWRDDYASEAYVELRDTPPALSDVVGSNRVALAPVPVAGVHEPMLTLFAALDNLLKGAAGQAVQNLNLMFDLPETLGLPC